MTTMKITSVEAAACDGGMVSPCSRRCQRTATANERKAAGNGRSVGACKYAARNLDRVVLDKGCAADRPCNCTVGSLQLAAADDRFAVRKMNVCICQVDIAGCTESVSPLVKIPVGVLHADVRRIAVARPADGDGGGRSVDAARNPVLCHHVRCDGGGDDGIGVRVRERTEGHRARREGGEDAWGKCP